MQELRGKNQRGNNGLHFKLVSQGVKALTNAV